MIPASTARAAAQPIAQVIEAYQRGDYHPDAGASFAEALGAATFDTVKNAYQAGALSVLESIEAEAERAARRAARFSYAGDMNEATARALTAMARIVRTQIEARS